MKSKFPRSFAAAAAWRAGGFTAAAGLALTALACRSIWNSHMEEADRQLKTATSWFCRLSTGPEPVGFLSGERAPFHVISLADPTRKILSDDASWPADDRAALEVGGRFKTRIVQSSVWRVMGIRVDGFSLRLAMDAGEVARETTALGVKSILLSAVGAISAAFLAYRHAARLTGQLNQLIQRLEVENVLQEAIEIEVPEISRLKHALQSTQEQSLRTLEAAHRFGADAGHELRTPLSVIQGSVDALLHRPTTPDSWPVFLESILVQCRKLRVTLDALQLLARADAGTVAVHRQPVQFDQLLRDLLDDLSVETETMDLRITSELAHVRLPADPALLRLAVWNLLINAARHNFPQRGVIHTSLLPKPEDSTIILTIANSGPPLAQDEHEVIFQRFHRGRTARQAGVAGQGLGLSLARACVEAHGGSLTLVRSDDTGTVMALVLPSSMTNPS